MVACGILLHGLWDIVHHNGLPVQTDIPGYYPTFCFTVDIIDGIFFLFLFKSDKKRNPVPLNFVCKFLVGRIESCPDH
jgi:hypothetical protein